jgi:hypothetical protein
MAVLTRKRYTFGGTLTATDANGMPVEHHAGDPVPDEWLARRTPGEIDALRGTGMLREVGAKAAPRAPEPPATPLTVAEILRSTEGWPRADVVDGQVVNGPRGWTILVYDKAAREGDLKQVLSVDDAVVVVHRIGGESVVTVSAARFAKLLAGATFGVR